MLLSITWLSWKSFIDISIHDVKPHANIIKIPYMYSTLVWFAFKPVFYNDSLPFDILKIVRESQFIYSVFSFFLPRMFLFTVVKSWMFDDVTYSFNQILLIFYFLSDCLMSKTQLSTPQECITYKHKWMNNLNILFAPSCIFRVCLSFSRVKTTLLFFLIMYM